MPRARQTAAENIRDMAGIIHLLPDSVANQIAAGEVIQRPASVVKELVENALDAKATQVDVMVIDAGKTSIQVVDNGCGMSETDARMAFERHATSKIKEASDLFALHTMGFRGEALPSVASVSEVELRTRAAGEELGCCISLAGSRVTGQRPVNCAAGANFTVRNLFYNVPARRRFLKSNQTELVNIISEFERIALAHPDVRFTLKSDGNAIHDLPKGSRLQRIADIFGKKMNQQLLPLEVDTSLVRISGFAGTPESARKKGAKQFFFANGRYMRHPYFHRAVSNAYERIIPSDEQVCYFIYFEVDPRRIDVNIHPTKTEIKFEDEQAVFQILMAAVKESLGKFNAVPAIDFGPAPERGIPAYDPAKRVPPPRISLAGDYNPFKAAPAGARLSPARGWEKLYEGVTRRGEAAANAALAGADGGTPPQDGGSLFEAAAGQALEHYQYKKRYIVTAVQSGLMIIDQHRAHIRILYEKYRALLSGRQAMQQRIMFPEIIQLTAQQRVALGKAADDILAAGFDLSDLGNGSYAVNAIPTDTESVNAAALLRDVLDDIAGSGGVKSEMNARIALTLARDVAIRPDTALSNQKMNAIINDLFATECPNYTPDGKPVIVIIPQEKIEKLFS